MGATHKRTARLGTSQPYLILKQRAGGNHADGCDERSEGERPNNGSAGANACGGGAVNPTHMACLSDGAARSELFRLPEKARIKATMARSFLQLVVEEGHNV